MNPIALIADGYDRKARLYPALILMAPLAVVLAASMPTSFSTVKAATLLLGGFGGAYLLTHLVRDRSKSRESSLYQRWGGMPSVAIFRHSNVRLDEITKGRYHRTLERLVEGTVAPTIDEEKADLQKADKIYAAWSHYLRTNTRDQKEYYLLFRENVSYGFRRNTWGVRPFGIVISTSCLFLSGWQLWRAYQATSTIKDDVAIAAGVSAGFFFLWTFVFTRNWVQVAANAYAERLAEATDSLAVKSEG